MKPWRNAVVCLVMTTLAVAMLARKSAAEPRIPSGLDIPIDQTVMRDGSIRYSVWVKVGDRSVEALLDTGSTGLRVLPAIVPGDLTGMPIEARFVSGQTMTGLSITRPVEIGSFSGSMPVQVIDGIKCMPDHPECVYARPSADDLIGGDGSTGNGFSAILGISSGTGDQNLPNPLEVLGVKQWIVSLPLPDSGDVGHLILNPDLATQAQFKPHPKQESGDMLGCLLGEGPKQKICGALALDTGGPQVLAVNDGDDPETAWAAGTNASLSFPGEPPLRFKVGDGGPATKVDVLPYKMRFTNDAPFINTGVYPYFFYDVLYDVAARKLGLRARAPGKSVVPQNADATSGGVFSGGPASDAYVDASPASNAALRPDVGSASNDAVGIGDAIEPKRASGHDNAARKPKGLIDGSGSQSSVNPDASSVQDDTSPNRADVGLARSDCSAGAVSPKGGFTASQAVNQAASPQSSGSIDGDSTGNAQDRVAALPRVGGNTTSLGRRVIVMQPGGDMSAGGFRRVVLRRRLLVHITRRRVVFSRFVRLR